MKTVFAKKRSSLLICECEQPKVSFAPDWVIDDEGASERNGVDVVDVEPGNEKQFNIQHF